MGLEVASYITDLVITNPASSDQVGQGDDHLRLLKAVLQTTFPNLGGRIGRNISCSAGYTVLSTDNTGMLNVPVATGATVTHTVSLPALASVTAGFYLSLHMPGPSDYAIITPTGGASIEGAATFTFQPGSAGRVFYDGTTWRAHQHPIAAATGALALPSTLSVSGAATFQGTVTVSGAAHLQSTISVGGAAQFGSTVTVAGATQLQSTLSVSGVAHFKSSTSFGGAAQFGSSVTVSGSVHLQSTMSVAGAAQFGSTVTIVGATRLSSTLSASGAAIFLSAATFASTVSVSATVALKSLLDLQVGQIKFPAAQNASADANVLDDYEEGTWTAVLTFDTPGDLAVTYTRQIGTYTKVGRDVTLYLEIVTATFTHTTASGAFRITGMPFTKSGGFVAFAGALGTMEGFTGLTALTTVTVVLDSTSLAFPRDVQDDAAVIEVAHAPTGVQKTIRATMTYHV